MKQHKYSIIVPVYNVEQYICRCIYSIYAQNYNNYEIICVNDGSTDNSPELLEKLAAGHDNVVIVNRENGGLGAARNSALPHVTGDYIWFVDSDDWIEPQALSILNDFINKESEPDIVLIDFNKVVDEDKHLLPHINNCTNECLPLEQYLKHLLLHQANYFGCGKLFKADKFLASGFRFPTGFYEDIALISYCYTYITTVGYLHRALYNYYIRSGSIMRTYDERVLHIYDRYAELRQCFNAPKWAQYMAAFFYVVSVKRKIWTRKCSDTNVTRQFWEHYTKYQKEWGYWSKYGLLNPYISLPMKLRMLKHLIIAR